LQQTEPSRALLSVAKAAEGLRAIHRMGYVHADMNPKNILLSKTGEVKLIDYGQSCKIGTAKKRVQGTLDYISPEQLLKAPLDPRTDVFTLGACMYWAVTRRTIGNPSLQAKGERRIGSRDIAPPDELNGLVSESLSDLIMKCLEENPSDRPRNIDEVVGDLHQEVRDLLHAEAGLTEE
jgi:serine/threonine-protein kinase